MMANALRVDDHLLGRLSVSTTTLAENARAVHNGQKVLA
jgi:hypothetical protein